MAIPESERGLGKERAKDTRDIYRNLLRLASFPENPTNLPESFTVPFIALGELPDAILLTENGGEEHRQLVYWYKWVGFFRSRVYRGDEESVEFKGLANIIYRILRKRALIDYHTHPNNTPIPSGDDILVFLSGTSYVTIIASKYWITAMTETSLVGQRFSPASNISQQMIDHYKDLERDDLSRAQVAAFLEKLGIGFYAHFSERDGGYKSKEFTDGLKLTRVKYLGQDLQHF